MSHRSVDGEAVLADRGGGGSARGKISRDEAENKAVW